MIPHETEARLEEEDLRTEERYRDMAVRLGEYTADR